MTDDVDAGVARDGDEQWNWAAGVVPALFVSIAWYAIGRFFLYRSDPSDNEVISELMFAVMSVVVLSVALAYLRFARSTAFVATLCLGGGLLASCGLSDRLLTELNSERDQTEAFARWLGSDVGSGGGFVQRLTEYAVVALVACGPFAASLVALGLRRRSPRAGTWNWALGAIAALVVLLGWEAGLEVAQAAAGQGTEMFAVSEYSGVVLVSILLVVATLLAAGALLMGRIHPTRSVMVGLVLVAGSIGTVAPTWRTFHRWSGMEGEVRAEHDELQRRYRAKIANGDLPASKVPTSILEPYEEYVRPVEQKVFALTQDLAPVTIALMVVGLRRRRGGPDPASVGSASVPPFDPDAYGPPTGNPVLL